MVWAVFIVAIMVIGCVTSLIKAWINRNQNNSIDEESFNRLARAFMQHKKEMEKRIRNLEAAEADTVEDDFQDIEVPEGEGTLTNDLQQKNRIQS